MTNIPDPNVTQLITDLMNNTVFRIGVCLLALGIFAKVYRAARRYYVMRYCKVTAMELVCLFRDDVVPDRVEMIGESKRHFAHSIKTSDESLEEKFQWCLDNVGNLREFGWDEIRVGVLFSFRNPDHALTFKLMYGE